MHTCAVLVLVLCAAAAALAAGDGGEATAAPLSGVAVLRDAQTLSGTLGAHDWAVFRFRVADDARHVRIVVAVQGDRTGQRYAPRMYVRRGAPPEPVVYDWLLDDARRKRVLAAGPPDVDPSSTSEWFVALQTVDEHDVEYALWARSYACPEDCSGHGACARDAGLCACDGDFVGPACAVQLQRLAFPRAVASGRVAAGQWLYYHVDVAPPTSAERAVHTLRASANTSAVDVHVHPGSIPAHAAHWAFGLGENAVDVCHAALRPAAWFVGVTGSSDVGGTDEVPFELRVAFETECPVLCADHGRCDAQTGTCQCHRGWAGVDCSVSLFRSQLGGVVGGELAAASFVVAMVCFGAGLLGAVVTSFWCAHRRNTAAAAYRSMFHDDDIVALDSAPDSPGAARVPAR